MSDVPAWEPPLRGSEAEAVLAALERQRVTFRWKAADLDEPGLQARTAASELTLDWLLRHLAEIEDWYLQVRVLGREMPEHDPAAGAYELWDAAAARSREAAAEITARGLDADAAQTLGDGTHPNIRRLLLDLLEEYARHTGHADLLREAIDGRTGEDPPWPSHPG